MGINCAAALTKKACSKSFCCKSRLKALSARLPPPRGGGHCLAMRNGKTFREGDRKTEISSARTAHRSAGEEKSVEWICAAHSHASLNYWSLYCTHYSGSPSFAPCAAGDTVVVVVVLFYPGIAKREARELQGEATCVCKHGAVCLSARSLHHLFIGESEGERVRERE